VVWGAASSAVFPLAQTLILRLAGPERRATAGALIPVLFNGGIALGAALASVAVAAAGVGALPLPAAGLVTAAAVLLGVGSRRAGARTCPQRRSQQGPATGLPVPVRR
jgi:predicted MFS family arabinose efflux permease